MLGSIEAIVTVHIGKPVCNSVISVMRQNILFLHLSQDKITCFDIFRLRHWSWSDLDLTFDLAAMTLSVKILSGLIGRDIGLGL